MPAARRFFPSGAECHALTLQGDGKLVAAGTAVTGEMLAVRLSANAAPDPSFGMGGFATIAAHKETVAATIDPAGRIVLAAQPDFVVARLLTNGQPDKAVGPEGWQSAGLDIGGDFHASAQSLAVQRDGAILVGGYQDFFIANVLILRYLSSAETVPTLSPGFALMLVALLALSGSWRFDAQGRSRRERRGYRRYPQLWNLSESSAQRSPMSSR